MALKLYAEIPARRTRQVIGDVWLVVWTALWIWIAFKLHDLIMNLAGPGIAIASGATDLATSIDSAGESVSGLPIVGDGLSGPFAAMSSAATAIADAAQAEADAVSKLAFFLPLLLAILAFASFAVFWVPIRIAFVRKANAAQRLVDANEDLDLFALRALARQPLHVLARIDPDPAGAWRRGNTTVIDALAGLELPAEGLNVPVRKKEIP